MRIVVKGINNLCVVFDSMVSATEQLELFELHVCIRDYCFAREDRLVGVAVMRLADISEQVITYRQTNNDFIPLDGKTDQLYNNES